METVLQLLIEYILGYVITSIRGNSFNHANLLTRFVWDPGDFNEIMETNIFLINTWTINPVYDVWPELSQNVLHYAHMRK